VAAFPFPMLETVLHPGDMAFIPKGWWHEVEALTPSFSVSFWW
jgi:lysine-specific demethylase 8